jgi:norsolorinic acid ketoreductase
MHGRRDSTTANGPTYTGRVATFHCSSFRIKSQIHVTHSNLICLTLEVTTQNNVYHIFDHGRKSRQVFTHFPEEICLPLYIGLGRALVEAYLSRPDTIVVAAVRNPSHPTSKTLRELPKASSSSLIIVKIDNASETDAAAAVSELRTAHNLTSIDVVIANAGIATVFPRVEEAQTSDLLEHFRVNAIGGVVLFRAVLPLLKQSQKAAKFIAMSTSAGTIGGQDDIPVANAAYGPSKAALNWLVKKIHLENEDLIAFPIHPG